VRAKVEPDGQQPGQGLVDVVVAMLHGQPVVCQHVLHVADEGLVVGLYPAWV
jgi:hypothetical protein